MKAHIQAKSYAPSLTPNPESPHQHASPVYNPNTPYTFCPIPFLTSEAPGLQSETLTLVPDQTYVPRYPYTSMDLSSKPAKGSYKLRRRKPINTKLWGMQPSYGEQSLRKTEAQEDRVRGQWSSGFLKKVIAAV